MRFHSYARALAALAIAGAIFLSPSFIFSQGRRPPLPQENMTAVVDGRIRSGFKVTALEGVPCLPLRDVQKLFGGRQSWKRVSRRVDYEIYGHNVSFALDRATASVDGKDVALQTPPRWWTGHVYVPVSFLLTEEFQSVSQTRTAWNADSRSLTVEPVPSVSSPRYYSYPEKSRLMFELGPRVTHRVMGYRGGKLYVRFYGGRPTSPERLEVRDGLMEDIEITPRGRSSDLTVSFAAAAGAPRVALEEGGRRWVMEVVPGPASADAGVELAPPAVLPGAPAADADGLETEIFEDLPAAAAGPLAMSPIKTIVIDAGHGGKDAGAVGAHGTLEKDVNLEIARALARVLKRERRFRVIMTRNADEFLPLEERTDIANKQKADLFVSIHANSSLSKRSNGFEIYFLSEKATDEGAAAVARRENAVVELEGVTGKAKQKLQELLWSLAKTETMNESAEVAALMCRQVDRRLGIPNRGVKQAGFFVLKGAAMPAVLVEAAFISHPREEGMLRSRRFQNKLADGLYAGLIDYEKRKLQSRSAKAP
jgi:N-acetylmuramoyl-L-alanine amidase